MKKNYVTFIVDASSSMAPHAYKMRQLLQETTDQVVKNGKGMTTKIAYHFFGSAVGEPYHHPIGGYPQTEFSQNPVVPSYSPYGNTALNDAIMDVIKKHARYKKNLLGDVAHLIVIFTDGFENNSVTRLADVRKALAQLQENDDYTFAFNAPRGGAGIISSFYAIPHENVAEWDQTNSGFIETSVRNINAASTYMTSRAENAGFTKSANYFVQTDLSEVTKTDLRQCDDFTGRLKSYTVPREQRVDEFVNSVAPPFIRGAVFYQLTKPEKIQSHKQLVVRPKNTQQYYGGNKVKDLLGIPQFKEVKVTPGNHANYDLFVQSTSDNRKLVRGSQILVVK